MKKPAPIFTTLLLALSMAYTLKAQWEYEIQVNRPYESVIPVVGVSLGWGLQLGPNDPLTAEVVVMNDINDSELGCVPSELGSYVGKIVLIRRGVCGFLEKVGHAFKAGAAGIIFVNEENEVATNFALPANLTADLAVVVRASEILIPVVMIDFESGNALIQALKAGEDGHVSIVRLPINPGEFEIIWGGPGDPNSEFDGGFNDWTPIGVSCNGGDPENAAWKWMIQPRSFGNFAGVRGTIASFSSYKGAVIFDSDYFDNAGLFNNLGNGVCAGPHRGELISPVIDLSNETSVALRFSQYYRRFAGAGSSQTIPATLVEVTNDGGATWTTFTLNTDIRINAASALNDIQILDISRAAAGHEAVQFRFVFDGEYYFWQIDDVYLVKLPDNNIGIQRVFSPIVTKYTPIDHVVGSVSDDIEGWPFAAAVRNFGGNIVENALLGVQIVGPDGRVEFDEVEAVPVLITGSEETIFQPKFTFDPKKLNGGSYTLTYKLFQEGITDFKPEDNSMSLDFSILNACHWQSGDPRTTVHPSGISSSTWAYGALIKTGDYEGYYLGHCMETYVTPISGVAADLEGVQLKFYVVEVLDGFGTWSQLADGTNKIAATGEVILKAKDNNSIVTGCLETFDGDLFRLKPNTTYYAMVEVPLGIRIGCDNQMTNFQLNLSTDRVSLYSRLYYDGFFRTTLRNTTPYIKLYYEYCGNVNDQLLPESYVSVFPNPTNDQSFVNLDFDTPMNATITLLELNGRVINFVDITNVTKHTEIIHTSALAAGTYMIRVATTAGVATKKLMVIK